MEISDESRLGQHLKTLENFSSSFRKINQTVNEYQAALERFHLDISEFITKNNIYDCSQWRQELLFSSGSQTIRKKKIDLEHLSNYENRFQSGLSVRLNNHISRIIRQRFANGSKDLDPIFLLLEEKYHNMKRVIAVDYFLKELTGKYIGICDPESMVTLSFSDYFNHGNDELLEDVCQKHQLKISHIKQELIENLSRDEQSKVESIKKGLYDQFKFLFGCKNINHALSHFSFKEDDHALLVRILEKKELHEAIKKVLDALFELQEIVTKNPKADEIDLLKSEISALKSQRTKGKAFPGSRLFLVGIILSIMLVPASFLAYEKMRIAPIDSEVKAVKFEVIELSNKIEQLERSNTFTLNYKTSIESRLKSLEILASETIAPNDSLARELKTLVATLKPYLESIQK